MIAVRVRSTLSVLVVPYLFYLRPSIPTIFLLLFGRHRRRSPSSASSEAGTVRSSLRYIVKIVSVLVSIETSMQEEFSCSNLDQNFLNFSFRKNWGLILAMSEGLSILVEYNGIVLYCIRFPLVGLNAFLETKTVLYT